MGKPYTDPSETLSVTETNPKMEESSTPVAMSDAIIGKDSPAKSGVDNTKKRPSPDSKGSPNKRLNAKENSDDSTETLDNSKTDDDCGAQTQVHQDDSKTKFEPPADSSIQDKAELSTVSSENDDNNDLKNNEKEEQNEAAEPRVVSPENDKKNEESQVTTGVKASNDTDNSLAAGAESRDLQSADVSQESKTSKTDDVSSCGEEKYVLKNDGAKTSEASTETKESDAPPKTDDISSCGEEECVLKNDGTKTSEANAETEQSDAPPTSVNKESVGGDKSQEESESSNVDSTDMAQVAGKTLDAPSDEEPGVPGSKEE